MDNHGATSTVQRASDDNERNTSDAHGMAADMSSPRLDDNGPRQLSSSSLGFSDPMDATDLRSDRHHSLDESDLQQHLQNVDSSFLPESGSLGSTTDRAGADDTYMNLVSGHRSSPSEAQTASPNRNRHAERPLGQSRDVYAGSEEGDQGQAQSSYQSSDGFAESPSAAAAMRNTQRANAPSSLRNEISARAVADSVPLRSSSQSSRAASLARSQSSGSGSQRSIQHRRTKDAHLAVPGMTASPAASSPRPVAPASERPSQGHMRQASHASVRSNVSAESDTTINADYALQSGGMASYRDSPLSSKATRDLTRLPSFGSVISDLINDTEAGKPIFNRGFSAATGLARSKIREESGPESVLSPATPRDAHDPSPSAFATDTVIANHVRNIRVPETVARDFQSRYRGTSPDKTARSISVATSNATGTTNRTAGGGNLTLKEQNSKIDKLTKENFDLKLKIHFLDQALQSRSDEGVKDLIDKNVALQTDLAKERRAGQEARRRLREVERRLGEMEEELAETREREDEARWSGQQVLETEVTELREELDEARVQITKLSAEALAKDVEIRREREVLERVKQERGSEEGEMWRDLLTEEQGRREVVEEEARGLRAEVDLLRRERDKWKRDQERRGSAPVSERGGVEEREAKRLKDENIELRRDLSAQTSMLASRNKERERLQQEIEDLKMSLRKGGDMRSTAGDSILERSASRAARAPSRLSARTGTSHVSEAERDEYERREGLLRDENAQLRLEYQDLEKEASEQMDYIAQLEDELKNRDVDMSAAVTDLQALQVERDDALNMIELQEADIERLKEDYRRLEEEAIVNIEGLEANIAQVETQRERATNQLKMRNDDFSALQAELKSLGTKLLQLESDRNASLKRMATLEQELDDANQELEAFERKLRESDQKNQRLDVQTESLRSEITFLREEQEADKVKIGDLTNALHTAQQAVADEKEKLSELENSLHEERRQRELIDDQSKQEVQKIISDLNAENSQSRDDIRKLRRNLSSKENEAATHRSRLEDLENNLRRALGDLAGGRATLLQDVEKLNQDLSRTLADLDAARSDAADKDRLIKSRDVLLESSGLEARRLSDLLDKERQARKHDLHNFEMAQKGSSSQLRAMASQETRAIELETQLSTSKRRAQQLEGQYKEQLQERNALLFSLWNRLSTLCGAEWSRDNGLLPGGQVVSVEGIGKNLTSFQRSILAACKTIEGLFSGFKSRIRMAERSMSKDVANLGAMLEQRAKRLEQVERATKELAEVNTQLRTAIANSGVGTSTSKSPNAGAVNKLTKLHQEEMRTLRSEIKLLQKELKIHRQAPTPEANERIRADPDLNSATTSSAGRRSSMLGIMQALSDRSAGRTHGDGEGTPASRLSPASIAGRILRTNSEGAVRTLNLHALGGSSQRQSVDLSSSSNTNNNDNRSANRASQDLQYRQQSLSSTQQQQQQLDHNSTAAAAPGDQRWIHRLRELEKRLKAEREARLLDRRGARQRLEERGAENEGLRLELERERERSRQGSSGGGGGGGLVGLDGYRGFSSPHSASSTAATTAEGPGARDHGLVAAAAAAAVAAQSRTGMGKEGEGEGPLGEGPGNEDQDEDQDEEGEEEEEDVRTPRASESRRRRKGGEAGKEPQKVADKHPQRRRGREDSLD